MRRRALLAASAAGGGGGGDTPFEAEFYFDYCKKDFIQVYCYRAPDELSLQCYERARELIYKYGVSSPYNNEYLTLSNPMDYGFSVYIEQELCTQLECYTNSGANTIYIITNGTYDYTYITSDGRIQCEYESL